MKLRRLLFTLIAFAVISSAKPVMTNQTVEAMLRGGVPVATILTAIRTAEYIQLITSTEFRVIDLAERGGLLPAVPIKSFRPCTTDNYKGAVRPEDVNPAPFAVALARPSGCLLRRAQPASACRDPNSRGDAAYRRWRYPRKP